VFVRGLACAFSALAKRRGAWYATIGVRRGALGVTGEGGDGASLTRGRVITVDIDPNAIEACRRITAEWAAVIEYVVSDSLEFFRSFNLAEHGPIDLLYLDGLDRTVRNEQQGARNEGGADQRVRHGGKGT
jgi:hypothetical protein